MKPDWGKWGKIACVLVVLYLTFQQPEVLKGALAGMWHGASTAFGPMITGFFSWLGHQLNSAVH